jgi:hypothetical protein
MLKTVGVVAGSVVVTSLVAGSMVPVSAGDDGDLRLLAVTTEENFVDNAPVGEESLGDSFVFSADLFKAKRNGKKANGASTRSVGRAGVSCVLTSTTFDFLCSGTVFLTSGRREGQVSILGLQLGSNEGDTFDFPIVGGTGDFEGASGTLTVRELSETTELLTFDFD